MAGAVKEIPQYLEKYYWWAYGRPWAAKLFDHQFMVNAILLGNYNRLRDEAVKELGEDFSGRTLQVGCCYGNLTPYLARRAARSGGTVDVIDVLPIQLKTLQKKIRTVESVKTFLMDAAALDMRITPTTAWLYFSCCTRNRNRTASAHCTRRSAY